MSTGRIPRVVMVQRSLPQGDRVAVGPVPVTRLPVRELAGITRLRVEVCVSCHHSKGLQNMKYNLPV